MNIQEYKTAHGATVAELDKNVNTLICDGFELFGNPYCAAPPAGVVDAPICQAMVKCSMLDKPPTGAEASRAAEKLTSRPRPPVPE